MTPEQIEVVVKLTTLAGTMAALILAVVETIKTVLEIVDQLRRRRLDRRGPPRRRQGPR